VAGWGLAVAKGSGWEAQEAEGFGVDLGSEVGAREDSVVDSDLAAAEGWG
jgi:hypothetical protein